MRLTAKKLKTESSGVELLSYMRQIGLTPCRVLAKDQLYTLLNQKQNKNALIGYNIINIGTLDTGGTHWVSLYVPGDGDVSQLKHNKSKIKPADLPNTATYFCSFGGYPLAGIENIYHNSILYYNKRQIQDIKQVSCGYFAIGALLAKQRGEFVYYCSSGEPKLFSSPGEKNEDILLKYLNGV